MYLNIIIFNFKKYKKTPKTQNFQIIKKLGAPQELILKI
jgi:hypothetical protein